MVRSCLLLVSLVAAQRENNEYSRTSQGTRILTRNDDLYSVTAVPDLNAYATSNVTEAPDIFDCFTDFDTAFSTVNDCVLYTSLIITAGALVILVIGCAIAIGLYCKNKSERQSAFDDISSMQGVGNLPDTLGVWQPSHVHPQTQMDIVQPSMDNPYGASGAVENPAFSSEPQSTAKVSAWQMQQPVAPAGTEQSMPVRPQVMSVVNQANARTTANAGSKPVPVNMQNLADLIKSDPELLAQLKASYAKPN